MSCVQFSVAKQDKPRLGMKARDHGTADSMDQVMLEITLDRYGQEKCREDVQRDARRPRLLVSCRHEHSGDRKAYRALPRYTAT